MAAFIVRNATPSDSEHIQAVVPAWWGHPVESDMFSPFFLTHFYETCFVAEDNQHMIGFVIGFLSQSYKDEAYIRFIVVNPLYRGVGVGRALYEAFFNAMLKSQRHIVRSVTSPSNTGSITFHQSMGFSIESQEHWIAGLPVRMNYHGREGTNRVAFVKRLA